MRAGFFQSTIVRLTLALVIAQVAALALGLTIIHRFTQATIIDDARIAAEVARDDFAETQRQQGPEALVQAIRDRLTRRDDRNFVVLLKAPDGTRVVGNLSQWPATVSDHEAWREIRLFRQDAAEAEPIGLITTPLPGGYALLTGEVLEAQVQLARASQAAFLFALAVGITIAGIVAAFVAWLLGRRIDVFSRAASAIVSGRLDARVERDRTGDAFDRLGVSINAMLDRIETLVGELRMLTDSMAHDLRSPVARMKAKLEQALGRARDPETTAALAGAIDEADSLHRLLDTALEISRAEAGIGRDQFTRFALAPLLEDMSEVYGPLAEDEGFAIAVTAPVDLDVVAHREMLVRALSNLIDNALKYAAGGTQIRLTAVREAGDAIDLAVIDDGPGIPSDRIAEAARRFVRLDPARGGSGAGLGLSLVETIAHMHGGRMTIAPAEPHGTVVTLRLPVIAPAA